MIELRIFSMIELVLYLPQYLSKSLDLYRYIHVQMLTFWATLSLCVKGVRLRGCCGEHCLLNPHSLPPPPPCGASISSCQVAKHLAKLFDSMAKLKFTDDASGTPTKEATGMYSKEGEFVTLATPLMCVGQVENWLSLLLDNMQETIRREFVEAVVTYEEMTREQWIFKPPAQVALAGTQIWWTTEVNLVFARLEEGYENALKDYYKKQVGVVRLGRFKQKKKMLAVCTCKFE